jgi:hypothetical protein
MRSGDAYAFGMDAYEMKERIGMTKKSRAMLVVGAVTLVACTGLVTTLVANGAAGATNYPADKMTVAASGLDTAAPNQTIPVLKATMRTSTVEDLVLSLSEECGIYTAVTVTGTDNQYAFGQIKMMVTIDNPNDTAPDAAHIVKVSPDDTNDPGKVVFCNRNHQATSTFLANESYGSFIRTRDANAFNWLAPNVGNGIHTITVWAQYQTSNSASGTAEAVIGKRSLVVQPTTQAQNQAT